VKLVPEQLEQAAIELPKMSCEIIIDEIDKAQWEQYARGFADYSIYQTWAYQQVRAETDRQQISRFVVRDQSGQVVTMGHVRIKHVKPLGIRVGYMQWGPLVRCEDGTLRCSVEALQKVREAYLGSRANVLRVNPNMCDDKLGQEFAKMLEASGFQKVRGVAPYHTMHIPLQEDQDVLRKRLRQSWRRMLMKAEKAGLTVVEHDGEEAFEVLEKLYLEMLRRKKFRAGDYNVFTMAQRELSAAEKMDMILAYRDGEPAVCHLASNLGDTGIFLIGASSEIGLTYRAAYLAWWRAIMLANRLGMKRYDVGGIDFETTPNVSRFKAGLCGDDVFYIGIFEAYLGPVVKAIWHVTAKAYELLRR
jgi:lipid II:glycine glycyltransferase (peptidoglycan interpeptide bridge formation enzyme)